MKPRDAMRRRINPFRRFSVEPAGEGAVRYTCRTCGYSSERRFDRVPKALFAKLVSYQANADGVTGHCARCTKRARDLAFPPSRGGP